MKGNSARDTMIRLRRNGPFVKLSLNLILSRFTSTGVSIIVVLLCSLYRSNLRPPYCRKHVHYPQLGGFFAGIGHGGGFFGPRGVPLSCPVCKAVQNTLALYQLLLLVKCRSVSMQCSHIRHFTAIETRTSLPCYLASQSRCSESQRRLYEKPRIADTAS